MHLYHYTSAAHLRGIARYGLTVGDVVTDIDRFEGRIGVFLTSSPFPQGHGLRGSMVDKTEFRLEVSVPDDARLHLWSDWATANISPQTRQRLLRADGSAAASWYVYFGRIAPKDIIDVVSTPTGESVSNWGDYWPVEQSVRGVPYEMRFAWQRRMLKAVRASAASMAIHR